MMGPSPITGTPVRKEIWTERETSGMYAHTERQPYEDRGEDSHL